MRKSSLIFITALLFILGSFSVFGALTDNLIGYFDMTNTSGTVINNISYMPNGSMNSVSVVAGKNGNALNFTGGASYVSLGTGNFGIGGTSTAFTMIIWAKAGGVTGNTLFAKWSVANSWYVYDAAGTLQHYLKTTSQLNTNSGLDLSSSTFEMITLRYNGTHACLWRNTTQEGTCTANTGLVNSGSDTFFIGNYVDGSTGGFNGVLDEFMVWNRSISVAELIELYAGGQGKFFASFNVSNNNITFNSSVPADITSTTLFNGNAILRYNISNTTNMNTTFVNLTVITSRSCFNFLNGTCTLANNTPQIIYNTTSVAPLFNYSLGENNIYPANRWLNDSYYFQTHSVANLPSNNIYYKLAFINVSNQTQYNFFEIMANGTGTTDIHYCNSSYTTGNVQTNTNCVEIFNAVLIINHTHSNTSAHALVIFSINNSRIGTVYVTPLSYFVIRGGNTNIYYISNSTGRNNITQTSSNNGVSFTDVSATQTVDTHLHQFTSTDYISYFGCRNISNNLECTSTLTDTIDLTPQNPIAIQILVPTNETYEQYINISYVVQVHPNTPTINNDVIRIDLLNNDSTFNQTIRYNALNSSYYWNTYDSGLEVNRNYYLNITINDTVGRKISTISEAFNLSTNGNINITAKTIGGATIVNFSVNITNTTAGISRTYNTTNGVIIANILKGYTYRVFIDATGYAYDNTSKTTPATYNNFTFYLYTTNSFNIRFLDEVTKALLSTYNISLEIISDSFANNYTTSNGTLYLDLLSPDTYTFRYKSLPTYPERTYIVDLQNRSTINLSLYLVNTTTTITLNVKDQNDNILEDAYIKVLRYDIVTNSYTVREIVKTNVEGNAYFSAILNTEYYKFIVEYPLGEEVLVTSPDYIRSTSLTLRVNLESNTLSDYYASINTYSTLTFNSATNNFNYYYNDASNTANQGCLYIYRTINYVNTLINSSCVSSSSGTILLGVTNVSGYTYTAQGTVFIGETEYLLKTLSKTFDIFQNNVNNKNNFFFLTLLLTAILSLLFIWNITIALIVTPLPLFLMSLTGMIPVSRSVGITLMLISLTLAFVISKKGG